MTSFELHTWGPAFGLPSIDAECIAAIAYLHHAIPSSEWTLIPSSDPSVTPSNRLPALRSSSTGTWTTGYDAIVSHISSQTQYNLDANLTSSQLADTAAYSSYLTSSLAPMVDVSLYAIPRNWTETTRPAYSTILPFPLTWTVPTALHAAAVKRTSHLLSGLSLNGDEEDDSKQLGPLDAAMQHIPTARRKGLLEELAPGQAATIRLYAMAKDALSVVEDLRAKDEKEPGSKVRLLSEDGKVSSLDCLTLGYLALMRAAPVPQDFLRKALAAEFPSLVVMLDDLSMICLEAPGPLPWADERALATASKSVLHTLSRFVDDVIRVTPQVGEQYSAELRRRAETGSKGLLDPRSATVAGSLLVAGGALAYGAWWYRNLPPFGLRSQTWDAEKGSKLSDFGALGAMLDFSLGGPPAPWSAPASSPSAGAGVDFGSGHNRIVEADVAVD
ncbi:outer mitochondrial membrane transport complex protein-domain-containing protein [Plectosphaerella plurivora]|uniref:Outer mitochondrial membrane transport complex protein-domain-containing protein n=1 Tax=Plectosphaerella plurivora TaxID=936078 RepID=A0A9P8VGR8_9PEZI|nr:outer mitochondrial membrane transport complex protein-domain-containing protein [Plectosphaerella plurivora]